MSKGHGQELILAQYKKIQKIGSGTFGNVYKCQDIRTQEIVAIKKLKKIYKTKDEAFNSKEILALQVFSHPNIVQIKKVDLENNRLCIVQEYLDQNLSEFIKFKKDTEGRKLNEEEIKMIMKQILEAIDYIHSMGYLHRDLKPKNFIINKQTHVVKMIDFGSVKDLNKSKPPFTQYVSTRWYRSPECLLRCHQYGPSSDIFAAGCIMAELCNSVPLFPGSNELNQLETIFKILGTPQESEWREGYKQAKRKKMNFEQFQFQKQRMKVLFGDQSKELRFILKKMLQVIPSKRYTAKLLLSQPFFKRSQLKTSFNGQSMSTTYIPNMEKTNSFPNAKADTKGPIGWLKRKFNAIGRNQNFDKVIQQQPIKPFQIEEQQEQKPRGSLKLTEKKHLSTNQTLQLYRDSQSQIQFQNPDKPEVFSQSPSRLPSRGSLEQKIQNPSMQRIRSHLSVHIEKDFLSAFNSPVMSPVKTYNSIQFQIHKGGIGEQLQKQPQTSLFRQEKEEEKIDSFLSKNESSNHLQNHNQMTQSSSLGITNNSSEHVFNYFQPKEIFNHFQQPSSLPLSHQNSSDSQEHQTNQNKYKREHNNLQSNNNSPLGRYQSYGLDKVEEYEEYFKQDYSKVRNSMKNISVNQINQPKQNSFHRKTLVNSGSSIFNSPIKSSVLNSILSNQNQNLYQASQDNKTGQKKLDSSNFSTVSESIINRAMNRYNV